MNASASISDDLSIPGSEVLLRRIPEQWIVEDNGIKRISSGAFENTSGTLEMSIDFSSKLSSPADTLRKYPKSFLASFTAKCARDLKQGVIAQPLPDDTAHGAVCGEKTKSIRRQFAKNCVWVKGPEQVPFYRKIILKLKRHFDEILSLAK